MDSYRPFLRRAMAAGALAGVVTALVMWLLGEPTVRKALAVENARTPTNDSMTAVFSRGTQVVGGLAAGLLYGLMMGVLIGLGFMLVRHRLRLTNDFQRAIAVAATGFVGAVLVPFLKYPANPPAVGDPTTITQRTVGYFIMVAWGLVAVIAAWRTAHAIRDRGRPSAEATIAALVVGVAIVVIGFVVLPASASIPADMPAGLIWKFRMVSLAGLVTTWTVFGLAFGWLMVRQPRTKAVDGTMAS